MRALHIVGLLVLGIFVYVTAVAQFADPPPADKPVEEVRAMKQRAPEDWLATCLADWDVQTHMTKVEWRTTCERVSKERGYFQLSTASVTETGLVAPRRRSLGRLD
jgi:hypothetical protein